MEQRIIVKTDRLFLREMNMNERGVTYECI